MAVKAVPSKATKFRKAIRVAAELVFPANSAAQTENYSYEVKRIWLDTEEDRFVLAADAGCDTVFVCKLEEIPEVIKFLEEIVRAHS